METAKIEQIKTEQAIFTDLWNIYKKYANISIDADWKMFVNETERLFTEKYKSSDKEELFREMLLAITNQLERNCKNK